MTFPPICSRHTWLSAFACLVATAAFGQQSEDGIDSRYTPTFGEVISVRVVNIEVVVTDRKNQRVADLLPEDFRLLVDGEETPIDFFSEIREGSIPPARTLPGKPLPEEESAHALPPAPGLIEGRPSVNFLVFIDDFFSIARDRNTVLKALAEDLDHLGPDDRMALVAYNGRDLEELAGWTNTRLVLESALEKARKRRSYGLQRYGELRANDNTGASFGPSAFGGSRLNPLERNYAQRLELQVERSIEAAAATMRSFASAPGRKVFLVLAGGWPSSPADYAANSGGFPNLAAFETGIRSYSRLLSPLSDTANLLGFTVYPIDVPGMQTTFGNDASRSGPGTRAQLLDREDNVETSLQFLARETGGRALINSGRSRALEAVAEDTRSYYWLGFTLNRRMDDRQHDIEVKVLRPGLRTRSRLGFVDLSQEREVAMTVEGLLLFGNPPGSLPLELRFGKAKRVRRGIVQIPLQIGFAVEHVHLIPIGNQLVAEVQVVISAIDQRGNRSETPVQTARVVGTIAPEPGQLYWFESPLLLRKRQHRIIVAVFDPVSGNVLSSTAEISP